MRKKFMLCLAAVVLMVSAAGFTACSKSSDSHKETEEESEQKITSIKLRYTGGAVNEELTLKFSDYATNTLDHMTDGKDGTYAELKNAGEILRYVEEHISKGKWGGGLIDPANDVYVAAKRKNPSEKVKGKKLWEMEIIRGDETEIIGDEEMLPDFWYDWFSLVEKGVEGWDKEKFHVSNPEALKENQEKMKKCIEEAEQKRKNLPEEYKDIIITIKEDSVTPEKLDVRVQSPRTVYGQYEHVLYIEKLENGVWKEADTCQYGWDIPAVDRFFEFEIAPTGTAIEIPYAGYFELETGHYRIYTELGFRVDLESDYCCYPFVAEFDVA